MAATAHAETRYAAKRPSTDALLAIDALPRWSTPAGSVSERPAPTLLVLPRVASPAHCLATPPAAPSPGPAALTQSKRSGLGVLGLGLAAGALAAGPFLDWRHAARSSGAAPPPPRYAAASLEPAPAVRPLVAVSLPPAEAAPLDPAFVASTIGPETDAAPIVAVPSLAGSVAGLAIEIVATALPTAEGAAWEPNELATAPPHRDPLRPVSERPRLPAPETRGAMSGLKPAAGPAVLTTGGPASSERTRIVVHYSGSRGRGAADGMARRIGRNGFGPPEFRQVPFAIRRSELRIFAGSDAGRASRVARTVGFEAGPLPVSNFSHYRPSPAAGLIEIWIR